MPPLTGLDLSEVTGITTNQNLNDESSVREERISLTHRNDRGLPRNELGTVTQVLFQKPVLEARVARIKVVSRREVCQCSIKAGRPQMTT